MKVREYIEELKKLDQERNIWVMPNIFHVFPPFPFEEALEGDEKLFEEDGLKKGDYIISETIE